MARFRAHLVDPTPRPVDPLTVREVAWEVLRGGNFFVAPGRGLAVEYRGPEEEPWEVFQGRLLDPAHTRQKRTLDTWDLYLTDEKGQRDGGPLLSLKLDDDIGELFVLRGIHSYVWEGYDAGGGVIESREVQKWVSELVAALDLAVFLDLDDLRDELVCCLFKAVAGSRLPLTSVEAPLPGFTFGEVFYLYRPGVGEEPARTVEDLWKPFPTGGATVETTKLLEFSLRVGPPEQPVGYLAQLPAEDAQRCLRDVFLGVSLSPWTDFLDRVLNLLGVLRPRLWGGEDVAGFLGWLLRLTSRHLTAYDLVTFHHRGANYPDALLLDSVLKEYLRVVEEYPDHFLDHPLDSDEDRRQLRLRRRALRQAWILRRHYEGLAVPDLPTSPGENARVLPASHPRVPEEQITQPGRRRRKLYEGDPVPMSDAIREVLRASALDLLDDPLERRELGSALFLDRPFGVGKAPAEPDGTILLASLAYSRSIALGWLHLLTREGLLSADEVEVMQSQLDFEGLPLARIGPPAHVGTVSLTDATRAAGDFVFLRTMSSSLRDLAAQYDCAPLAEMGGLDTLLAQGPALVARAPQGAGVIVYDGDLNPRLELEPRVQWGFAWRAGQEKPRGGLLALRAWQREGEGWREHDLRGQNVVLWPR